VLAPPSPARARVLAALARDDRAAAALPLSPVLRKVAATRLLRAGDVAALEAWLAPHHKATTAGGASVARRAVTAHNVAAAARVYASLSLADLGDLLGVGADAAEGVAAGLVAAGGVDARIDAVAGVVRFGGAAGGDEPGDAFDEAVRDVCAALDAAAA
jgi:COP9 signalosome complex subunit 4